MSDGRVRWLLDTGLPRTYLNGIDAVHAEDFSRVPGPCGIREAVALDRALVTCDQEFLGPWSLSLDHPGIVVMEGHPNDASEIERNLKHFEFRLRQYSGTVQLTGNRFVLKADREAAQVLPDGSVADLAPWRQVRMESVAFAGSGV